MLYGAKKNEKNMCRHEKALPRQCAAGPLLIFKLTTGFLYFRPRITRILRISFLPENYSLNSFHSPLIICLPILSVFRRRITRARACSLDLSRIMRILFLGHGLLGFYGFPSRPQGLWSAGEDARVPYLVAPVVVPDAAGAAALDEAVA